MNEHKSAIEARLSAMRAEMQRLQASLTDRVSLESYRPLVRMEGTHAIWTDALQRALSEHQVIEIPGSDEPYYIDATVTIPSNRRIEAAPDAVIRLQDGVTVLMLRNEHTMDGTHRPVPPEGGDFNISIDGGRWEEYHAARAGYGRSGKYDEARSFYGVSTCMLFNHMEYLSLTNMVFARTAGFGVQTGSLRNAVMENIAFEGCFADGLHINGDTENLIVRNIHGEVGDDLVALNMYDWQNSSVNFGPGRTILCENIDAAPDGGYKSFRIQPGVYPFADGSEVDCALDDVIIRGVRGVHTFKLYYQTPAYVIGEDPEPGRPGSGDHIYFEDVDLDLAAPVDAFDEYLNSDPLRGAFAAIEIGSQLGFVSLENVRFTLHHDRFPLTCPVLVGPKSIRVGDREIFDPYVSCRVRHIRLKDVTINGQPAAAPEACVHTTAFNDVNADGHSTGCGIVDRIELL